MKAYVQTAFGEVELHLYHRRERALRLARRLGASVTFVESAHAQTNGFDSGDNLVCFVLLEAEVRDADQLAALMAHEAVHVSQIILDHFGEDEPGEETRAYLVQNITYALLDMQRRWASGHPTAHSS